MGGELETANMPPVRTIPQALRRAAALWPERLREYAVKDLGLADTRSTK